MPVKLTQEQFIEKAKATHGNKYDYNKIIYIGSNSKITIICSKHGDFEQTANSHLNGQGCPRCWFNKNKELKRDTQEQFIQKAKSVHGDKYDYSKVDYANNYSKVIITCPDHGTFYQIPSLHIRTSGCPKCGNNIIKYKLTSNINKFIEKAKSVHGDKYDYSKVDYTDSLTKIDIKCKEHGDFLQLPSNHLQGQGCPKCRDKDNSLTNKEFIAKATMVHNNKYDYSKVNYINCVTKVIIVCPLHGEFQQRPQHHLYCKSGCHSCNASKGELALKDIFKKYNIEAEPQYNIPEIVANYEIDFYLPEYRLLIEFHGKQHYEYIPFFHDGDYTFEDQKTRDTLVRDAAIMFKYNYLEFNYKQFKYMSEEEFEQMVINKIYKINKI